jgi:ComF family protein
VQALLDLLLPPICPACGREGARLCGFCRTVAGRRVDEPVGIPLGLASSAPAGLVQLEWCSSFSGPARAAVHALKYDGEQRLAQPLGSLMAERWRRAGIGGDVLAHVPVHADRRRQRGFDQAELLARAIGPELALPVVPGVARTAATRAQHALGRSDRAINVGHAFVVPPQFRQSIAGRWVVLVDDVVTTGATVAACAAALHEAGAAAVSALAFARER